MKNIFLVLMFLSVQLGFTQTLPESEILGIWISEHRDGKIEIYKLGEQLYGKIVWTKNINAKDDNNPDVKLRSRPLLGLVILKDFAKVNSYTWEGGEIYDPESGKTYSCNIKLNKERLEIRGYVGFTLFGRTSVWTRK